MSDPFPTVTSTMTVKRRSKPRKPPPGQSLLELNPALASQWHPTKNGEVTPLDVFSKAGFVAWWRCPNCPREWEASVSSRAFGNDCKDCRPAKIARSRRMPPASKSLATVAPDAAERWHPVLNGDVLPDQVYAGSGDKRWWICAGETSEFSVNPGCSAAFEATPVQFVESLRLCQPCRTQHSRLVKRRPVAGQSVADLHPDIASEWHPTLNGELTAFDVRPGSEQRAYWICEKHHVWPASVINRRNGNGCKECWLNRLATEGSHRRTVPFEDSIAFHFPHLLDEWHPTRNLPRVPQSAPPASSIPIWWRCSVCDFEWDTLPVVRARGGGCPECYTLGLPASRDELHLSAELIELLPVGSSTGLVSDGDGVRWMVDIIVPSLRLLVEYDGAYWHRHRAEVDLRKTRALESSGWSVLRVRESPLAPLDETWCAPGWSRDYKATSDSVVAALAERGFLAEGTASEYLQREGLLAPEKAQAKHRALRVEAHARRQRRLAGAKP